jgi:hypothetical protein
MSTSQIYGQDKCKVLKKDIEGEYKGSCKKGLAHGDGISIGENTYEGKFKNGLPSGEGTMAYSNGEVYIGNWKKGLRSGYGKTISVVKGKDIISEGKWKKDVYIGKWREKPYVIKYNRTVTRYNFRKVSDDVNRVTVIVKNNGASYGLNLNNINGDSGQKYTVAGSIGVGYENIINYPFKGEITYSIPSKFYQSSTRIRFDFEILGPGDWVITLNH